MFISNEFPFDSLWGKGKRQESNPPYQMLMKIIQMSHLVRPARSGRSFYEEKSNGEFQVDLYPSSQLGTKNDIINQAIAGDSVINPCKWSVLLRSWSKGLRCCILPHIYFGHGTISKS